MSEIEKTCENCKYDNEDTEGTHCRHCIHNAVEHFEPKVTDSKSYNKVIDEFAEKLLNDVDTFKIQIDGMSADVLTLDYFADYVFEVAEQMKGGSK